MAFIHKINHYKATTEQLAKQHYIRKSESNFLYLQLHKVENIKILKLKNWNVENGTGSYMFGKIQMSS